MALVVLLTDFGTADGYVGVMKGVMLGIAPDARLVDLSHEIAPQDVEGGAWVLGAAWRYFPDQTIFLCVVDPGVGTARRPVALRAGGRSFVGPDNGLFTAVLAVALATEACVLDHPAYQLPTPSATFHGRDVFAPAAAHLARGVPLATLGSPLDPASLTRLALPAPTWQGNTLIARVAHVDHFGNLISSVAGDLAERVLASPAARVTLAGRALTLRARTFGAAPAGQPFLLLDSSGALAIALRDGSAAALLGGARGAPLRVEGVSPEDAGAAGG